MRTHAYTHTHTFSLVHFCTRMQVIDSRTFGYIPLTNIVGRVIYAASSRKDHGPVINNPVSVEADQAIIEGEVDVDRLLA